MPINQSDLENFSMDFSDDARLGQIDKANWDKGFSNKLAITMSI